MIPGGETVLVTFEQWTQSRKVASLGTNSGADVLPFQNWRHFKEAFAPELVARAVAHSDLLVSRCLDPFGGSGTTALACQFLGIHPTTAEVNPFLADLIEAKLTTYDPDKLARDLGTIARTARNAKAKTKRVFNPAPKSFVEPGVNGRWIFDRSVADRIAAMIAAISNLPNDGHRRLFRVLLGGVLLSVSNVVVNGKGRRYRSNWQQRLRSSQVDELFFDAARAAISDVHRFAERKKTTFNVLRGDARKVLRKVKSCELAIFSPPYPNSFDYTDVYNVELWTLGYLTSSASNRALRVSTIASHVQISREFAAPPPGSSALRKVLKRLEDRRSALWDKRIPEMVGAYFSDLATILDHIHRTLATKGAAWMVVGDSCYAGVQIPCAEILTQVASTRGWQVSEIEPFRSMRSSAQQGGQRELGENLLVLRKPLRN